MMSINILLAALLSIFGQQADYPIPDTPHLLFYLQRTHNANTIVYDANFDKDGNLNPKKPVDVYWLRYDEQGQRMELRAIERWRVFGVTCVKTNNGYDYRMKLAAKKTIKFWLRQTAPFQAEIITDINGVDSKLDHLFVTTDEDSFFLKVKYGEFFGTSLATGKSTYRKIIP